MNLVHMLSKVPISPRLRMPVILGMMLFIGFLLTSTVSFLVSRNSIRTSILQNELPLSSDNVYSEVQRDLFEPILISSLMANDTFVKDWLVRGEKDEPAIAEYLDHIQKRYGTITSFLISDATRKYYNANGLLRMIDEKEPNDTWFFRVRAMKKDYEINVDPDYSNKKALSFFINYRIKDKHGKFLGATGVGLSVNSVTNLIQKYRTLFQRDVYFYNREGKLILYGLDGGKNEAALMSNPNATATMRSMLEKIDRGETNVRASAVGRSGALANYRYIPELDWILVVEQASDRTHPILFRMLGFNFIICLLTAVVLLAIIRKTVLRYQKNLESKNRLLVLQKAQLHEANVAREKLFAIIGHDLRGPVGNLKFSLDLLSDGYLNAESFREIQTDLRIGAAQVLVDLDKLMQWGSLEGKAFQSRFEKLSLSSVARQGIQSVSLIAKHKDISIECAVPDDAFAWADSDQIQAVIRNLLSNAIKFTPKEGRIRLSAEKAGDIWRISIQDNGIGIDPARASRLLDKDSEARSTLGTDNERGLGLGLQLCRDFVQANHGILSVKSSVGKGSTFSFGLPAFDPAPLPCDPP